MKIDLKKILTTKRLIFLAIFAIMVFVGNKINFSPLVGANNQFFTLFQFFGPIAGAFLGPVFGILAVLSAELADYIIIGKAFTLINMIRLTPMLFAAWYFGANRKKISAIIPLFCIGAFILHPVGRQAWFFSLYWLIPIAVTVLLSHKKVPGKLFLRSLGATFTAHAVGGAAWVWAVPMEAGQWVGLIPVVAYERLMFAAGIGISYVVVNTLLEKLTTKAKVPSDVLHLDKKYVLSKNLFGFS